MPRPRTPKETVQYRAKNLWTRIHRLGLTPATLAAQSGVSPHVIQRLLDGQTLTAPLIKNEKALLVTLRLLNWHQLGARPQDFILYPLEPADDEAWRLAERTIEKREKRRRRWSRLWQFLKGGK
ncbi:MAG: hypothetical protein ABIH23_08355 [bacterium]